MVQLLTNPGAETNTSGWTGSNATLTRTTNTVRTGSGAFRFEATAAGSVGMNGATYTVEPTGSVVLGAWFRSAATPRNANLYAEFYASPASGGGYVGTQSTSTITTTTSGWTQGTRTLTVPAGAGQLFVYVRFHSAVIAEVHYADDLSVDYTAPAAGSVSNDCSVRVSGAFVGAVTRDRVGGAWVPA